MSESPLGRPALWPVLRLRCPYCAVESLRKDGSWFDFKAVCPRCHYKIERENGYFTGASWMINFPVTGTLAFLLVVVLYLGAPSLGSMGIAAVTSLFTFAFGIWFFPFSQSLWLWMEHSLHPLRDEDRVAPQGPKD